MNYVSETVIVFSVLSKPIRKVFVENSMRKNNVESSHGKRVNQVKILWMFCKLCFTVEVYVTWTMRSLIFPSLRRNNEKYQNANEFLASLDVNTKLLICKTAAIANFVIFEFYFIQERHTCAVSCCVVFQLRFLPHGVEKFCGLGSLVEKASIKDRPIVLKRDA